MNTLAAYALGVLIAGNVICGLVYLTRRVIYWRDENRSEREIRLEMREAEEYYFDEPYEEEASFYN